MRRRSELFFMALFVLPLTLATLSAAQETPATSTTPATQRKVSDVTLAEDPYLWLEEVEGQQALDWVRERNAVTQAHYESSPEFEELREDLLKILDSDERIPFVSKHGEFYYNFWRDKQNERGLWRRTTLEEYRKSNPNWEILLDLDALAKQENENWVWDGAALLKPGYDLALIELVAGWRRCERYP